MARHNIDVLFAVPPRDPDAMTSLIRDLYADCVQSMAHGLTFTGRPGTCIRCDAAHVLKLSMTDRFAEPLARRRIKYFADRDTRLEVAHPDKAWIALGDGNGYRVANLTPRLRPLHVALPQMHDTRDRTAALKTVVDMCVSLAFRHGRGLDPGLSNFGMDDLGRIHYLDDDYYEGSGMTFLVQAVQLWFRSYDWLSDTEAERLGASLSTAVLRSSEDKHILRSLTEELRNAHFQERGVAKSYQAFMRALSRNLAPSSTGFPQQNSAGDPRIAVLADIHANLPALEAVLADIQAQGIHDAVILGDLVGYGPFPKACVAAVQHTGFKTLKGNHDHGIANGSFEKGFSSYATWVASWSYHQLDDETRRWLDDLPLYIQGSDWLAVHGAPCDKHFFYGYVYRMTYENNLETLKSRNIPICFHGHTHIPGVYHDNGVNKGFTCPDDTFRLVNFCAALVCPGSIGQPRNGTTDAQYMIYDTEEKSVILRSIQYDIGRTLDAMRLYDFPKPLVQRLEQGC